MEDRIEINGVWYVRETSSTPPPSIIEIDESLLTTTQQIIYEDGDYCFCCLSYL
jgi:Arc/MetJ family transcription regulator